MMFWRVLLQMLRGGRGRLAVALVALVSGAAVISALLNIELDVSSKLRQEFRTLGANLVVAPRQAQGNTTLNVSFAPLSSGSAALMNEDVVLEQLKAMQSLEVSAAPFLYIVARSDAKQLVVVGTWLDQAPKLSPSWKVEGETAVVARDDPRHALIGGSVASQLHLAPNSELVLNYLGREARLTVAGVVDSGSSEDSQIFVNLPVAQRLANLAGQIGLAQLNVGGSSGNVSDVASKLASALPDYDVRPIPQVTAAEGALLEHLRLLIFSMVALILVLTSLCVLATMAALAIERREDVGLMKVLGGSISRVVRFFLAEVGMLGAAGGAIGCFAGLVLSKWLGHRVFEATISVRWEIIPITIFLMISVALAGAWPLRMLGNVKPSAIFRGE